MEKESIAEHLRRYHLGERNAATSRELETAFGIRGKELRDLVNTLRRSGVPIASSGAGYFYAATEQEVRATIAHMTHRIGGIAAAILRNVTYTGDQLWQKTFATDVLPFKQIKNRGQKPQYYAEQCGPVIIDRQEFDEAQELMRKKQAYRSPAVLEETVLAKRIVCGECGSACRRKMRGNGVHWVCRRHDRDRKTCPVCQVREIEIVDALRRCHYKLRLGCDSNLRPMLTQLGELRERELRANNRICDIDREMARLAEQNLVLNRLKDKGYVDPALYLSQQDEINGKALELRRLRRSIMERTRGDETIRKTEVMLDYLEDGPEWLEEIEPELFEMLIDRLALTSDRQVKIRLINGLEVTEPIERTVARMAWQRTIPFGYQMRQGKIECSPADADTVRDIFARYLQGESLQHIATAMTTQGNRYHQHTVCWNKNMVKRVLENSRYLGDERYPRVIGEKDFLAVQMLRSGKNTYAPCKVSGQVRAKAVCGQCGAKIVRVAKRKKTTLWQCKNPDCGHTAYISDEGLVAAVNALLDELAHMPEALTKRIPQEPAPSGSVQRVANELTNALNRGTESVEYLRTLVFAYAAEKYSELPDSSLQYKVDKLRERIGAGDTDKTLIKELLETAVRSIRITDSDSIALELVNGQIIVKEAAEE